MTHSDFSSLKFSALLQRTKRRQFSEPSNAARGEIKRTKMCNDDAELLKYGGKGKPEVHERKLWDGRVDQRVAVMML